MGLVGECECGNNFLLLSTEYPFCVSCLIVRLTDREDRIKQLEAENAKLQKSLDLVRNDLHWSEFFCRERDGAIEELKERNVNLRKILQEITVSGVSFVGIGYSELQVSHEALRIAKELLKGGEA